MGGVVGLLTGIGTLVGWASSASFRDSAAVALAAGGAIYLVGGGAFLLFEAITGGPRSDGVSRRDQVILAVLLMASSVFYFVEGAWFIFRVFGLGSLVVAIWAVGALNRHLKARHAASEKNCPDCAETIKRDALVCRHCGYRFNSASDAVAAPEP